MTVAGEGSLLRYRQLQVYALLVVVPVLVAGAILVWGARTVGPATAFPVPAAIVSAEQVVLRLPIFLAQIIVIITAARLLGHVIGRFGQPAVVGEMLAGLLLGRSFLGLIAPVAYGWLFPVGTVRFLNALSQFGLVLFMFLVGVEMEKEDTSRARGTVAVIAHASIAVPMLLGVGLAVWLYRNFATTSASFVTFALFLGCAMSVTAFPVLARILRDRQLSATPFGQTAIACAAVADVTTWIILAVVLAAARQSGRTAADLAVTAIGAVAYIAAMLAIVRPLLDRWWRRYGTESDGDPFDDRKGALAFLIILVLSSALVAELLKIHALFGAFLAGMIMPANPGLRRALRARFADILAILLLPLFFAYAGIRADVTQIGASDLGVLALIIIVAVGGKVGGTALAARFTGSSWREGTALGVLMNTRGLIELVLLTVGLQAGLITPGLFTLMVLMALITTMMATPLLKLLVQVPVHTPGA